WFIGYPETSRRYLGGGEPTRLLRFSPYLNVTVFRHLAFKPPGAPPPRFMLELLPPDEASRWRRRRGAWPDLRVYRSILQTTLKEKRWQRFRWNPVRNCAHWDAFEGRLDEALAEMRPITDRDTARRRSRQCAALVRAYLGVHVCSLLFANIWFELAEGMLGARGLDAHISTLLRPSAPTWTARTNHALWALARGETDEPSVLAEFGHRAPSSWELFSPRWREDPAQLRALARGLMGRPDPLVGAVTAVAQADAMSRQLPGDLRPVVTLARRYLRLREDQRFHFDRLLWRWKEAWLWLEGDTGLALRFLESDEADALLDQDLGLARAEALIARREAAWRAEQERRACGDAPPVFLVGE
ncbi:MAG: hypothetical protein VX000_09435, partial [Myxococcota bacterium]|nr:hypothetical protein [Myxococcota bacterium]